MTLNDLKLNECNVAIRVAASTTSRAMREGDKEELRKAYKRIFESVWAGMNRLDEMK